VAPDHRSEAAAALANRGPSARPQRRDRAEDLAAPAADAPPRPTPPARGDRPRRRSLPALVAWLFRPVCSATSSAGCP
jgi:hypothetical protein